MSYSEKDMQMARMIANQIMVSRIYWVNRLPFGMSGGKYGTDMTRGVFA